MSLFRCFIRGEHFPGSLLGESEPVGFYTTRFVEAPSALDAERAALALLRAEPEFELVRPEDRMEDAQVYFEKIEEVPEELGRGPDGGFTFFPMGT
ncbi:hypothetical protein FHY30_003085 [Xanthomonas arboricola]|nr:hypothetical protein [Xanthomonas campestris]MCW2038780.1 hypothetical protein [Xanthomonas campestris]